jgi:hypothetical protein
MMAFVTDAPGNFVTINNRTAILTQWNVSQRCGAPRTERPRAAADRRGRHPTELIKLGRKKCGAVAIKPVRNTSRFLVAFRDGCGRRGAAAGRQQPGS